jgi:hypothetical protein
MDHSWKPAPANSSGDISKPSQERAGGVVQVGKSTLLVSMKTWLQTPSPAKKKKISPLII